MNRIQHIDTGRGGAIARAAGLMALGWLVAVAMLADPAPPPLAARAAPAAQQLTLDWHGNSAGPLRPGE